LEEPTLPPLSSHGPAGMGESYEHPLQQLREEIYKFAEVLYNLPNRGTLLETGAGDWCGTHFLWRMIFDKVITIEIQPSIIDKISYPPLENDYFIIAAASDVVHPIYGDLYHPPMSDVVQRVKNIASEIDVLFIDSAHDYQSLVAEYKQWMPLVGNN